MITNSILLPYSTIIFTDASRLVTAENTLKCIRCCGKGWVISASKSNDCFYFDVGILIHLNSICFFLFDFFTFPLTVLFFYCLFRLNIILFVIYFWLSVWTRWLLVSSITRLLDWSFGTILFSKLFSNTSLAFELFNNLPIFTISFDFI